MKVESIPCGQCGRDTVDGDCYGCRADRLYSALLDIELIINHREGLWHRVDLITADERRKITEAVDKEYRSPETAYTASTPDSD